MDRKICILAIIFLMPLSLQARKILLGFYPDTFTKGEVGIVSVEGLDPQKDYVFSSMVPARKDYHLTEIGDKTTFVISIPLSAGERMEYLLKEDGRTVCSNRMRLDPKTRKVTSLTLADRFQNPDRSLWPRLDKEGRLLSDAKSHYTNIRFFGNAPSMPVYCTNLTSLFGDTRIVNGKNETIHYGVDFAADEGVEIVAAYSGRVILARDLYYGGKTVMIEHGLGLISQYSHLSAIWVEEGDFVLNGAIIGRVGSTGQSTGPHLHLGFYLRGTAVDPLSVFRIMRKFY